MAIVPCELGPFGDLAWWFRARRKTETFERCPRKKSVKKHPKWYAETNPQLVGPSAPSEGPAPSFSPFVFFAAPSKKRMRNSHSWACHGRWCPRCSKLWDDTMDTMGSWYYGNFMAMEPTVWIVNMFKLFHRTWISWWPHGWYGYLIYLDLQRRCLNLLLV